MSKKVYLAGPMSGVPDYNFPAFEAGAKKLRELGYEVFSPHEADLERYGTLENVRANATYRDCLRVDLNWILDHADAIALLPKWALSKGVAAELALANALSLEVFEVDHI